MVEHSALNRKAAGSSPASSATLDAPLFYKGAWRKYDPEWEVFYLSHPSRKVSLLTPLRWLDSVWDHHFLNATPPQD